MATQQDTLNGYVSSLLESGQDREAIEALLLQQGHEEPLVKEIMSAALKQRYAVRRNQGLNLILSGGGICFLSFLLTITSSFSHGSFPYVLYGLTSVGILVAFSGLMKVF